MPPAASDDNMPEPPPRHPELEYASNALIGVLTPQANTTVEPEFAILLPRGHGVVNARLTSAAQTIEARLLDYVERLDAQRAQFSNAPIDALAFATTGASYLIGRDAEDRLAEATLRSAGVPLVTAARAVCDALAVLSATRIALLSPYPPALTQSSRGYWISRGFDVAAIRCIFEDGTGFHPIYSLRSAAAESALADLASAPVDAIVMLGTGLPTLWPIARAAERPGPAVLSCMLCLVWRAVLAATGEAPSEASLRTWLSARHWRERLSTWTETDTW